MVKILAKFMAVQLRSPYQILDPSVIGPASASELEKCWHRYDDKLINYLQLKNQIYRSRKAADRILQSQKILEGEAKLIRHCVVAYCGIGGSEEMAFVEWIKIPNAFFVKMRGANSHAFVVAGVPRDEFRNAGKKGDPIEKVLARLSQGVLIDPALRLNCPIAKLQEEGESFLRYNRAGGLYSMMNAVRLTSLDDAARIEKKGAEIFKKIEGNWTKEELTDEDPGVEGRLFLAKYRREILPRALSSIKSLFPKFAWEENIENDCFEVVAEGTKKELEPIAAQLKERGLQVTLQVVEGSSFLRVQNPNPDRLKAPEKKRGCCQKFFLTICGIFSALLIIGYFLSEED